MKSTIVFAVLLFVIGSALGQTAPTLLQQFTSNFTVSVDFQDPNGPQITNAGGIVYFAWIKGALSVQVGYQLLGQYFPFELILSPSDGVATFYATDGSSWCRQLGEGGNISMITEFYPFQIPSDATYVGVRTVNGQSCTGWKFLVDVFGIFTANTPVTLWVAQDGSIVQIKVEGIDYWNINDVAFNFEDTTFGPFPPSVFAPPTKANPTLDCKLIPI